ncbi:MAG: RNA polymerase sporulation sigma factor SigH [Defluviitaleaceae bacterium]|nr:RNA polymerase sporulation sigma factor SigH [Defluviitaleaceae bacterium]
MVNNNDEHAMEYIITKYKNLVKIKARAYFLIGADKEDIIQEGMIGLYKAIRDFKHEKEVNFNTFAGMCITRQIITAIKTATRQKHMPLNSYISLNKSVYDEEERQFIEELIPKSVSNPEDLLISEEDKIYIEESLLKHLSGLENEVLTLYLDGNSYFEIAEKTGKDEKAIDNAIQRARKKVEKIIKEKA